MKMPNPCEAYQASDQMICARCRLSWDVNDLDPPVCAKTGNRPRNSGNANSDRKAERRKRIENNTSNQRRSTDPGEFKAGPGKDVTPGEGRRFIDRALGILGTKSTNMTVANPMDHATKKETKDE